MISHSTLVQCNPLSDIYFSTMPSGHPTSSGGAVTIAAGYVGDMDHYQTDVQNYVCNPLPSPVAL